MTDNEIIKALRFCSDQDTCSDDCSFYVEGETVHECTTKLSVAALALIKRQQERMDGIVEQLERIAYETADWMYGGTMKAVNLTDAIVIVKGVQNE